MSGIDPNYERIRLTSTDAKHYEQGLLTLPDDVLSQILAYFPLEFRMVCRRTFKLVGRKSLLSKYKILLKGECKNICKWLFLHKFNSPTPYLIVDLDQVSEDEHIEKIFEDLSSISGLRGIEIRNAFYPNDKAMNFLNRIPQLESFIIPRCLWDCNFKFKSSKNLTELRITEGVKAINLKFLYCFPSLKRLAIPFSKNYEHLTHVPLLNEFCISQPYKVDFSHLAHLNQLEILGIPAQEEGFEHVQALPKLKVLKLCNGRTGLDLRKLHRMTSSLVRLDLLQCDGSVWHPEALSKMPLSSLALPLSWTSDSVKRLASGTLRNSLDQLEIHEKHRLVISQESVQAISAFENLKSVSFVAKSIAASSPLDWSPLLELKQLSNLQLTRDMDIDQSFQPEMKKLQTLKSSQAATGKAEMPKPIFMEDQNILRSSLAGCRIIPLKVFAR